MHIVKTSVTHIIIHNLTNPRITHGLHLLWRQKRGKQKWNLMKPPFFSTRKGHFEASFVLSLSPSWAIDLSAFDGYGGESPAISSSRFQHQYSSDTSDDVTTDGGLDRLLEWVDNFTHIRRFSSGIKAPVLECPPMWCYALLTSSVFHSPHVLISHKKEDIVSWHDLT